jgi:L-amino acid N-acyltransferase YncA
MESGSRQYVAGRVAEGNETHANWGGMLIRDATADDWRQIWPFLREIVTAGETYAYDPDMDEATARELWLAGPPVRSVVAVQEDGTVLGTANMYPNRPGPGSHVASASFMVDPRGSGRGVGRALGEEALVWARASGFRAIQFNAVVATNTRAVALWRSLGFEIIGGSSSCSSSYRWTLVQDRLHLLHVAVRLLQPQRRPVSDTRAPSRRAIYRHSSRWSRARGDRDRAAQRRR